MPAPSDDAAAVAKRIGYPVVLKAQAAALSHKTEAGGVMLNLADEAALRAAWDTMMTTSSAPRPASRSTARWSRRCRRKGIELMVGAKRDPGWGTVLLLGLGGIWVEALGDVQLLPGDAGEEQIVEALQQAALGKAARRVRGAPPADIEAVVKAVMAIGRLMRTMPEMVEIDVNPLMVHAKGQGVTALDALIVAE